MKRGYDHGNAYKGKHLIGVTYSSEVESIVIIAEHAGMVLEKELRALHLDPQAA